MEEDPSKSCMFPSGDVKLQEIIKSRRAEHKLGAEQKRKRDIQRIREMKSTVGIHPLEQFPKEVWKKIFDELDPWDRDDAGKVHPVFRDLMEETRVRDILLPRILWVNAFRENIKGSFKQLRRISKSTRNSFDRLMEDDLSDRIHDIELENISTSDKQPFCVNIRFGDLGDEELQTLKTLLASFKDGDSPPKRFPLRALSVSFSEQEVGFNSDNVPALRRREMHELRDQLKTGVTALLEIIGDQIWHFRFFMMEQEMSRFSFSETYILFQNWVTLMPKLKWLEFCVEEPQKTANAAEKGDKMTLARLLLQAYPFPCLASLERLSLHFHIEPPVMEFYETVIAANPHIKTLDLIDVDYSTLRLLPIPLIQSLSLTGISVNVEDWMTVGFDLESFIPVVNFNWPLKSIMLDLDMGNGAELDALLRFLQKFSTLENVKLNYLHNLKIGDSRIEYLELPNLKDFDITLHDPAIVYENNQNVHLFFSLQFLLPCKKMNYLQWRYRDVDDVQLRKHLKKYENPAKAIDFRAGLRFMYDSNIWDVFPDLDSVVVDVTKKRREGDAVQVQRPRPCKHTYSRTTWVEKASVTKFLKSHSCCQKNALHNCVVLLE